MPKFPLNYFFDLNEFSAKKIKIVQYSITSPSGVKILMKPTQGTTLTKGHSNGIKEFGMGRHGLGDLDGTNKTNKYLPKFHS